MRAQSPLPLQRRRQVTRGIYDHQPIEPGALEKICDFVEAYPGMLHLILDRDRERVVAWTKTGRHDADLTRSASVLLVLTANDDSASLVAAGNMLDRLLLTIRNLGLQYSIVSTPLACRQSLQQLIGSRTPPQLILRVGQSASEYLSS
jgi:hypothetical protein